MKNLAFWITVPGPGTGNSFYEEKNTIQICMKNTVPIYCNCQYKWFAALAEE